jgi:hypothetical protein
MFSFSGRVNSTIVSSFSWLADLQFQSRKNDEDYHSLYALKLDNATKLN